MKCPNECNAPVQMKRIAISVVLFTTVVLVSSAQRSRVLSVFQLIESEKYEEAKEAVELAVWNDKTSRWHLTYYAKGSLCQAAWEKGFGGNDTKKTGLYPEQLQVAYNAYEKALELGPGNRTRSSIATKYFRLANNFQKLGEKQFGKKEYARAASSFEHALLVTRSPLISVKTDTNLIYNTAIAFYEAADWEKAALYLEGLHQAGYSSEVSLLLFKVLLEMEDPLKAGKVLVEGLEKYRYERSMVLYLVDHLVTREQGEEAVSYLREAIEVHPNDPMFPWTLGLVYKQTDQYDEAIEYLKAAYKLAPEQTGISYSLGICYFNMGVEVNDSARKILNRKQYEEARQQARDHLKDSVEWLEVAYELDPEYENIRSRLTQLYDRLQPDGDRAF